MTDRISRPDGNGNRVRHSNLRRIAWSLAVVSLMLSIIGVLWLRLWIPGLVIGGAALMVSFLAVRQQGERPSLAQPVVVVGALALAVPIVIAVISIIGALTRTDAGPPREELQVELRVHADGDFTVTYTEPRADGAAKAAVAEVAATDEFETSFTTRLDGIQFVAAVTPNNIGPQTIRCEIVINGESIVDESVDERYIDCSSDLQDLHQASIDGN